MNSKYVVKNVHCIYSTPEMVTDCCTRESISVTSGSQSHSWHRCCDVAKLRRWRWIPDMRWPV